ncbi:hypothetical protein DL95DRAFT_57424 [Leptodontidium sp. 2 PMI_412]|nr:hypothetical protein DL95DRAFT_57424 [Leptodontidium sp. 2 PMI_412]
MRVSSCNRSFYLLKSESTLIQWVCSLCHTGQHWYIFECTPLRPGSRSLLLLLCGDLRILSLWSRSSGCRSCHRPFGAGNVQGYINV